MVGALSQGEIAKRRFLAFRNRCKAKMGFASPSLFVDTIVGRRQHRVNFVRRNHVKEQVL
jgi:hypothetical protein